MIFSFQVSPTSEIYTLSLHDALPIFALPLVLIWLRSCFIEHTWLIGWLVSCCLTVFARVVCLDRKSTRLNSSHSSISYVVFCLNKKPSAHGAPTKIVGCRVPQQPEHG